MKPIVSFQARWSGVGNLMGGVLGVLAGAVMLFSKMPMGFVFLLAGIGAFIYGGVLLKAVNEDDSS